MTAPLADASISLRLYPHDLAPPELVTELAAQARLAEQAGFDGVMTSEHHAGFPNYLPNPLLAATWALDATERIWAAPCPLLLALRPVNQVVEDLAWTAHRYPGRLGAGFASGALPEDFELSGVPFDERVARFRAALAIVVAAMRGEPTGLVAADPGVAALAGSPVPSLCAAQGPVAARRAARLGLGLLFDSLISVERAAELVAQHAAADGTSGSTLIRRAWVGVPPGDAVDAQLTRYRGAANAGVREHWTAGDGVVAAPDPAEVAERLAGALAASGCRALNVRVFNAGLAPAAVRDQIARIGEDVLPSLRRLLSA